MIDETDNPSGRGAARLRVEAGTPNWRPDRANKPPSFQLGVKPVCMLNKDLHHCLDIRISSMSYLVNPRTMAVSLCREPRDSKGGGRGRVPARAKRRASPRHANLLLGRIMGLIETCEGSEIITGHGYRIISLKRRRRPRHRETGGGTVEEWGPRARAEAPAGRRLTTACPSSSWALAS